MENKKTTKKHLYHPINRMGKEMSATTFSQKIVKKNVLSLIKEKLVESDPKKSTYVTIELNVKAGRPDVATPPTKNISGLSRVEVRRSS